MGRGDAVGAVKALTRAAHLSPSDTDRARRLAEAAYIGADAAGALRAASELLEAARQADPNLGASLRAASAAVMLVLNRDGSVDTAHRLLAGAVEAGGHLYNAGDETLVDALHLLVLVCFFGGREELWAPLYAALDRLRPGIPELLSAVMQTFADPARTAAAARRQVGDMLGRLHDTSDPAYVVRAGSASLYADRLGDVRDASWRIVHQGRDGGPARRHIGGLMHLCLDDYLTGRWDEVLDLAAEGTAVCDDSGYDFFRWYFEYCRAIVAAARGDVDTSGALADHITQWALPRGVLVAADYANHCRATAALGTGDFESAFHHAEEISPAGTLASHRPHALWVVMDLVEAAVRTNRLEKATAHVRAVQESGAAGISPRHTLLTLGSAALCAPTDDESLALFEKALSVPDLERRPFDIARVQLAYGERLRRARATVEARKALKSATDTFRQLGARPWAERAAKELRASGWTQARTAVPGAQLLTPQELEIARLAASGLTNKQIAARLFLSHRTVGSHLYQIFPKLGIGSRAALGDALAKAMPDD
ncbi:helix-turn-helix transcriptional regulator [Actinacidiphila glaucinigra]|uniref:helix-turn-helix transcriptional regulator n=1 Tax=Actinacidiphila glaucinigra TaxID=235986 RepID=UPI0035E15B5D